MADGEYMIYITGIIKTDVGDTNITLILDDDSIGHDFKKELVAKYNWIEIDETIVDIVSIETIDKKPLEPIDGSFGVI